MGATVFLGYKKPMADSSDSLTIGFNRWASDALEALISDALEGNYPKLYEQIMEMIVLNQISFVELTQKEFNDTIKIIRACLANRRHSTEDQLYEQKIWEEEIEPLITLDTRYDLVLSRVLSS